MLIAALPFVTAALLTTPFSQTSLAQAAAATVPTETTPSDSVAVHRGARRAQEDFERARRTWMPPGVARYGERCTEIVGRFCFWHDDDDPAPPPPEPARIGAARERLLERLRSAAREVPGDTWISGQLVRYLVEAADTASALEAAAMCRGDASWCAALTGFARHTTGDHAGAEAAFDQALALMSDSERCEWNDLGHLLEGELHRRYRRLDCAGRVAMNERLFWLAQPLWMREANDFRSEHFARMTMSRIEKEARSAYRLNHGEDVHELTVRYGWSTHWSQDRGPSAMTPREPAIIGHGPRPTFHFLPSAKALDQPWSAEPGDWLLKGHRTRYAPSWVKGFVDLRAHVARFRRGDSAFVIAAFEVADTGFGGTVERALVLASGDTATPIIVRDEGNSHGVLTTTASWDPQVASVEVYSPVGRRAARMRSGMPAASEAPPISDLLLFRGTGEAPTSLSELVPLALSGHSVRRDQPLGLYWEGYDLSVADSSTTNAIELRRVDGGALRRVAEALRLARSTPPVRMSWNDWTGREESVAARGVELDVSEIPPGRYVIELVVSSEERELARTAREIRIVQ